MFSSNLRRNHTRKRILIRSQVAGSKRDNEFPLQSQVTRSTSSTNNLSAAFIGSMSHNSTLPSPIHVMKRRNSLLSNFLNSNKNVDSNMEWHHPSFLQEESVHVKDNWLSTLLKQDLKERHKGHYSSHGIDVAAYYLVMDAWATSGEAGAPQKTEEWLSRLERHYEAISYPTGESAKRDIDKRSGNNIHGKGFDCKSRMQPTTACYNAVLRAWALSKDPIIPRAERILDKLKHNRTLNKERHGNSNVSTNPSSLPEPNTESYNLLLRIFSKGHLKRPNALMESAERAQETLKEMLVESEDLGNQAIEPTTESFNYVLRSLTRCRTIQNIKMTENVMEWLRYMELRQRTSISNHESFRAKPNTISYCIALDAFGVMAGIKAKQPRRKIKQKDNPEVDLSNSDGLDPYQEIQKAEDVLKYMHDLEDHGSEDVAPNTIAYNTIIGAHARISSEHFPDAPFRAEEVLRRMVKLHQVQGNSNVIPDERSYLHVIQAWSKAKRLKSGDRAEFWLRRMYESNTDEEDVDEATRIKPSVVTYNAVIQAYCSIGEARKAEDILKELLDQEDITGIRPNSESFSLGIRAWLKHINMYKKTSDPVDGCRKALKWLSILLEREQDGIGRCSSSPELFSSIIKTIHDIEFSDIHLLEIALKTFSRLKKSRHHMDQYTYQWILKIGMATIAPSVNERGRSAFLNDIIKSCCDDGLISGIFISALTSSSSCNDDVKIAESYFSEWPMPNSWTRNVKNDVPKCPEIKP